MKMNMENNKYTFINIFVVILLIFSIKVTAQMDTVYVPGDVTGEGNLNSAVTAHIGNLSNTVFSLELNGYYILSEQITIPDGEHLTIIAPEPGTTQETAPPQIVWSSNTENIQSNFECRGNITLKNIWLLYANTNGIQTQTSLEIVDNFDPDGQVAEFENVIFEYSRISSNFSGAVSVSARNFKGYFKNCYFRNCTDEHFRYYGRAVSFPFQSAHWNIDSLFFENCTFANIGFVFSQEYDNYSDNVWFNHCTFLNTAMFTLESGWWYKLAVTNSIFINAFMYGHIPVWNVMPYGATIDIDSLENLSFFLPFEEGDRHILFANSSYFLEEWLTDWMQNNPYSQWLISQNRLDEVPVPQPMMNSRTIAFFNSPDFPYMNSANLFDGINPDLISPLTNVDSLKSWLLCKWDTNCDVNWAYDPQSAINREWPMNEDLSYTNEVLKTAGIGSFPLGDLYHWWPAEYAQWEAQKESEYEYINTWLETGQQIPVELVSFNADASADKILLSWQTATELNNYGFEIQRSINKNNFVKVGFVKGFGTKSETQVYSFVDKNVSGKIYYRLKQVDLNGTFEYSDVIEATTFPDKFSLSQNFPNPFNPTTLIKYSIPQNSFISLKVFNLLGQEVVTLYEGLRQAGNYVASFDGSALASGVYVYQLKVNDFLETKKLILLK